MEEKQEPKKQEQKKVDGLVESPRKEVVESPGKKITEGPKKNTVEEPETKIVEEPERVDKEPVPDDIDVVDIVKIEKEISPHLMEKGILFTGELMKQATHLVKSGLLPKDVNTPEKAIVIMQKGRELGFKAMASFEHIVVINGKATLDGVGLMTLLRRGGVEWETVRDYDVIYIIDGARRYSSDLREKGESVPEGCPMVDAETVIRFFRPSKVAKGGYRIEDAKFTYKEAATAGLLGKDTWRKYLRLMLWWRTFSPGSRRIAGDLTMGMPSPEEIDDSGTVYLDELGVVKVVEKR